MTRTAKNYEYLIGSIQGISEPQFRAHFELYEGYVRKLVEIEEKLGKADPKTANYSYGEISELLRRRPVAYNGANLHELFFENLTSAEMAPSPELKSSLERYFGTVKQWFAEVRAGLISEPGWVLLTRSRQDGSLRNNLLQQHHIGLLGDQDIILAFDGWEHGYFIDYGAKKGDYITTLERSIHWDIANQRFEASGGIAQAAA